MSNGSSWSGFKNSHLCWLRDYRGNILKISGNNTSPLGNLKGVVEASSKGSPVCGVFVFVLNNLSCGTMYM